MIEEAINNLANALNRVADAMNTNGQGALAERVAVLESKTESLVAGSGLVPLMNTMRAWEVANNQVTGDNGTGVGIIATSSPLAPPQPAPAAKVEVEVEAEAEVKDEIPFDEPPVKAGKPLDHDSIREIGKRINEKNGNAVKWKAFLSDYGYSTVGHIPVADIPTVYHAAMKLLEE